MICSPFQQGSLICYMLLLVGLVIHRQKKSVGLGLAAFESMPETSAGFGSDAIESIHHPWSQQPTYRLFRDNVLVYKTPIEAIWQWPEDEVKGLLIVAHGCSHSATDFWPFSKDCPTCIGLPEEMRVVAAGRARGFAVLAISSENRDGDRCWNPSVDIARVAHVVQNLLKEASDARLWPPSDASSAQGAAATYLPPVVVFGASSGGAFAGAIAEAVAEEQQRLASDTISPGNNGKLIFGDRGRLAGVIVQIMAVDPSRISQWWPPTAFVAMSRDHRTAAVAAEAKAALQQNGVPARVFLVPPLPIDGPEFFRERMTESDAVAAAIFSALVDGGLLTKGGSMGANDGVRKQSHWFLARDPRQSKWRQAVRQSLNPALGSLPLAADASPLSEVLNVAWAQHELTAQSIPEALGWICSAVSIPDYV